MIQMIKSRDEESVQRQMNKKPKGVALDSNFRQSYKIFTPIYVPLDKLEYYLQMEEAKLEMQLFKSLYEVVEDDGSISYKFIDDPSTVSGAFKVRQVGLKVVPKKRKQRRKQEDMSSRLRQKSPMISNKNSEQANNVSGKTSAMKQSTGGNDHGMNAPEDLKFRAHSSSAVSLPK